MTKIVTDTIAGAWRALSSPAVNVLHKVDAFVQKSIDEDFVDFVDTTVESTDEKAPASWSSELRAYSLHE